MANSLIGSVGESGRNRSDDVRAVYALFNKILSVQLEASDVCSVDLIRVIREFQQEFMSWPDGRIDVGGRTWEKLKSAVEASGSALSGSVGEGGQNHSRDVRLVYTLFNKILSRSLEVSDQCTDELVQAIKDLQKGFLSRPDGRIDVGGRTWKRLTTPAGGTGQSVLLSFDDGPSPTTALYSILDTLDRYDIKAEFYVLGQEVDRSLLATKEIAARGHKVQNHTYTHPNLARASKSSVRKELGKTQESIKKATGSTPTKIRPPYGAGGWPPYDRELRAVAQELSLSIHNWDIDTEDWKSPQGVGPSKRSMIERQFARRQNQAELNVLMHVLPGTADDLGDFIEQLQQWGFSFAVP